MRSKKGFTLIELLLVVAIIAILAGVVIIAINPTKQLGDTRNAQRRQDVVTILNAVYQHALDHNGSVSKYVYTASSTEVCLTGTDTASATCGGLVDLQDLTLNEKYLVRIPFDPSGATTTFGTGYFIDKTANDRVTVVAVGAEQGQVIKVTR